MLNMKQLKTIQNMGSAGLNAALSIGVKTRFVMKRSRKYLERTLFCDECSFSCSTKKPENPKTKEHISHKTLQESNNKDVNDKCHCDECHFSCISKNSI